MPPEHEDNIPAEFFTWVFGPGLAVVFLSAYKLPLLMSDTIEGQGTFEAKFANIYAIALLTVPNLINRIMRRLTASDFEFNSKLAYSMQGSMPFPPINLAPRRSPSKTSQPPR